MYEDEYASADLIPQEVKHLYRELDGKWVLLSASEVKTTSDVERVQEGLRKEREDHKVAKRRLALFGDLDAETIHAKLDRFDELEAASGGTIDETKMSEMVEVRLRAKTAPLERQIANLTTERDEFQGQVTVFEERDVTRTIQDKIRIAATAGKVQNTAIADALAAGAAVFQIDDAGNVVTRDNVGVTPGIDAAVWLTEMKVTRPHWWPESRGVGANGGQGSAGGVNPFSADGWNLTEQGTMVRADRTKADQMARAAGTTVGGPRPVKK